MSHFVQGYSFSAINITNPPSDAFVQFSLQILDRNETWRKAEERVSLLLDEFVVDQPFLKLPRTQLPQRCSFEFNTFVVVGGGAI